MGFKSASNDAFHDVLNDVQWLRMCDENVRTIWVHLITARRNMSGMIVNGSGFFSIPTCRRTAQVSELL